MNNKARYAIVMTIGVIMNQLFYTLASIFHLPVWLDVCGTAFASIVLEPTAGLLVGLVNNFYLALFQYDSSTLVYYSISAAVALISGLMVKKNGKIRPRKIIPAMLLIIVVSALLSSLLTLWRTGTPTVGWEQTAYNFVHGFILPSFPATICSELLIKSLDTIASAGIVAIFYVIIPKKLKTAPIQQSAAQQ